MIWSISNKAYCDIISRVDNKVDIMKNENRKELFFVLYYSNLPNHLSKIN